MDAMGGARHTVSLFFFHMCLFFLGGGARHPNVCFKTGAKGDTTSLRRTPISKPRKGASHRAPGMSPQRRLDFKMATKR